MKPTYQNATMNDSMPSPSQPQSFHLEVSSQTGHELPLHTGSNSPTASTATTLHVPHDAESEANDASSNEPDPRSSDASSIWQPSAFLETATTIPQPMFTRSATRLTLTKPLSVSLYMHHNATASSPQLFPTSPGSNSLQERGRGRDSRCSHIDSSWDVSELRKGPEMGYRTRQSVISISHGMNPLGSNPPDPRDTIRYSVVEVPRTPESELGRRQRRTVLKERIAKVRSVCLGCLKGAFSRGAR